MITGWPLARYRFRVVVNDDVHLPAFAGAQLRSLFGHSLKRLSCAGHHPHQAQCPADCPWSVLFDPPRQPNSRFTHPTPPVVFQFPHRLHYRRGEHLDISMVLQGVALQYLPLITDVWRRGFQEGGIGKARTKGTLVSVAMAVNEQMSPNKTQWQPVYNQEEGCFLPHQPVWSQSPWQEAGLVNTSVTLHWLTPVRLLEKGRLITAKQLTVAHLARALLRRIQQASGLYLHQPVPDWATFYKAFASARLTAQLSRISLNRYSSRQGQSMRLDGLQGTLQLDGLTAAAIPWLVLGQYLHLGKNSTLGLGQYWLSLGQDKSQKLNPNPNPNPNPNQKIIGL